MTDGTMTEFIQKLASKSDEGLVPWDVTADKESFVVGLSDLTVTVSRRYEKFYEPEEDEFHYDPYVRLEVRDKTGTLLDEANSDTSREGLLQGLYESARQVALDVRTRLDAALRDLDGLSKKA